jgi:hydrogenase/urease accessory protein HupE
MNPVYSVLSSSPVTHRVSINWNMTGLWVLVYIILLLVSLNEVSAHESRPAYLEITESPVSILRINWTRPTRDERALNIHPVFPKACQSGENNSAYQLQGLIHERWVLNCGENGLTGQEISIAGLSGTISDVLLRYQTADGSKHVKILDIKNPVFVIPSDATPVTNISPYYFRLGVLHILSGADHLLFVLGLLMLIRGSWNLVKTITAFTLAHSVSLIAVMLGYIHAPSAPVEAMIALSILFLACELVRENDDTLSRRLPWLIAAVFGLVHGLGFAGGLSEIGLPQEEIPLALFMFNIGVEAGQLLFVIAAIGLVYVLRKFALLWIPRIEFATSYVMGSVAAFWFIERVWTFY